MTRAMFNPSALTPLQGVVLIRRNPDAANFNLTRVQGSYGNLPQLTVKHGS